jgi:hypothetical protein
MIRKITSILKYIHSWVPFSWQGLALLLLIAYLVFLPILNENDVVLSVVCLSLIVLLIASWIGSLLVAYRLRNRTSIEVLISQATSTSQRGVGELESLVKGQLLLRGEGFRLLPFFGMNVTLNWQSSDLQSFRFYLSSIWDSSLVAATKEFSFPYRGTWNLKSIQATLNGPFRLTKMAWNIPLPKNYMWNVGVSVPSGSMLPLLTSSNQPGGEILDESVRLGDYYDLKPYHPSDGINRVVWKIFAKSGYLIAREPERASSPEGNLLMYVWANKHHDVLAGVALRYLLSTSEAKISYTFGCLGMKSGAGTHTFESSRSLLIESAMEANDSKLSHSIGAFIDASRANASGHGSSFQSITIFCDESNFSTSKSIEKAIEIGALCQKVGLRPNFFIPKLTSKPFSKEPSLQSKLYDLSVKLKLLQPKEPLLSASATSAPTQLGIFENACQQNRWGLYRDRGLI